MHMLLRLCFAIENTLEFIYRTAVAGAPKIGDKIEQQQLCRKSIKTTCVYSNCNSALATVLNETQSFYDGGSQKWLLHC